MPLFRLYAYAVEPQRTVLEKDFVAPIGGPIAVGRFAAPSMGRWQRHALSVDPHGC